LLLLLLTREEADPEKIRAFQEEEFQRRLRGEREQAQVLIGEVVSSDRGARARNYAPRWSNSDSR